MATQEELLKALRGTGGREQVNFDLGQVGLRPTIQRGGQYAVPIRDAPRTNPALQLASALKDTSQLLNSFVDIQLKQGEIEASVLSPQEVQQKVEQGDPTAVSFLDKLGKEKSFTENVYKRYFNSTVQPQLLTLQEELKSRPVHEYADMGITTTEDFNQYASGRVQELTEQFSQYTSKSPYAQALHNQLVETIVPDLVIKQTSLFDEGVTKFNKEEAARNLPLFGENNGVSLKPESSQPTSFREKPRGTIYGFEKKGDATFDTNSSFGIGANASEKEMQEIKAGKTNDAKLVANKDFALSPDLEEQVRAAGFSMRDTITFTAEDGTTHTGRWMDRTAKQFKGKTLSGRVDIYSPNADSPARDKVFVGFSKGEGDPVKKFSNDISNVLQVGEDTLASAEFSPAERSILLRKHSITQLTTLSKNGSFAEARKLLAALSDAKVNNQPLFGNADGQLELASMEDLIDREEEQEYASNERATKKKVEEAIAPLALKLLNASSDKLEETYDIVRPEITALEYLTDAEEVEAIKQLDQLYQNKAAAAYTKATRSDNTINKLNAEGGSTDVFNNFRDLPKSEDRIAGFVASSAALQEKAYLTDPLTQKPVINPAFTQQMRSSLITVGSQKSLLNQEQTEKIQRGEAFTYDVNGKSIEFDGTTDPKQQKQLHLKLAQAFNEDLNASLLKQLETDLTSNPLFTSAQGTNGQAKTPYEIEKQNLIKKGIPVEQAEKLATKTILEGTSGILDSKGNVLTNRGFQSPAQYVKAYTKAFKGGLIPAEQAETAHNAAIYNNKVVVSDLAKKFDNAPAANMGVLDELEVSFTEVGIPFEVVQKGYVTYSQLEPIGTGTQYLGERNVNNYWSIKQFLERPDSETKYRIIPVNLLREKDNPEIKKVIEGIAEKYGKTYDSLVAGQEAWYKSRNIKISK